MTLTEPNCELSLPERLVLRGSVLVRRAKLYAPEGGCVQYQHPYPLPAEYLLAARQSAGGELV